MTIYNVHLYREMRLYFPGISAASHQEAAIVAADKRTDDAETIGDCDGTSIAALVDVEGDCEFENTQLIDFKENKMQLDNRQTATMLASLRLYQAIANGVSPVEALLIVDEVATDCGQLEPLTPEEIDALCEQLNQ
jgi:hypothetical protein